MTVPPIDKSPQEWCIVRDILHRHVPDREVWDFGSRAKRNARTYSDLDLAVITDTPLPFACGGGLAEDFSASDLPFRVDILDWATTRDDLRRIVERDRVIVQPASADREDPA